MKSGTIHTLYEVQELMKEARKKLDTRMYHSGDIPKEDLDYCRKVYDVVCKVMDLL